MRGEWKEWTAAVKDRFANKKKRERVRRPKRLHWALKSCDRLFDPVCKVCDKKLSGKARDEWMRFVSTQVSHEVDRPTFWSANPIQSLKARVRELVGTEWGECLARERKVYVPDQQGCLEIEKSGGGTLGCHPSEFSRLGPGVVRVGVAKTKGKHRVVTMQSANVKEQLTPVHTALYDHLTSFGWCVRGDVTSSDFETVAKDRRFGEWYISGDYENATNNIYTEVVGAIVDVLCESKHLTAAEVEILRGSFTDLHWLSRSGNLWPIRRGSMMGNLVSFPVLCLLNKACYDLCRDYEARWGDGERDRKVRINGDDIMFCGTQRFYELWVSVTSHFGLVVNEEKTGLDRRFFELNSRSYDCVQHRFVGKPVLSFLSERGASCDLLSEVVKGMASFSKDILMYVLNDLLRYEISVRPISLDTIPTWLWRSLIKRKWFRVSLQLGPLPVRTKGVVRDIPVIVGPPCRARFYPLIDRMSRDVTEDFVSEFRGVKVRPAETTLDRREALARRDLAKGNFPRFVARGERTWAFAWPAKLYKFVRDLDFDIFLSPDEQLDEWLDDHPFIVTRRALVLKNARPGLPATRSLFPPPLSLLAGVNRDGFITCPNGDL
jgi:hypothetical protein